ncbi:MAG: transposase [Candidatus Margulisbacteria bacterium]|nr:transposase [Candidatus Margulisiibacteriota bacterium]
MKHINLKHRTYFITTNTEHKTKIFTAEKTCHLLLFFMDYYRKQFEYLIYGYVIMPDHFHWLIHLGDKADPPLIMGRLKGRTSYEINQSLNRKGKLWQDNYYDHVIRNGLDFKEKINYIHKNPYQNGLVKKIEDYKYSSYRNYYLGDDSVFKFDYPNFDVVK